MNHRVSEKPARASWVKAAKPAQFVLADIFLQNEINFFIPNLLSTEGGMDGSNGPRQPRHPSSIGTPTV